MKFTNEEKELIYLFAGKNYGVSNRLYYVPYMVAISGFGVYGFLKGDVIAMAIALVAAIAFIGWQISNELKYAPIYVSLLTKVATMLNDRETSSDESVNKSGDE